MPSERAASTAWRRASARGSRTTSIDSSKPPSAGRCRASSRSKPTTLEPDRLILRPPVPEDAEPLAPMYADPEVMRYLGDGHTLTREETERSVRRLMESWKAEGFGLYTTVRKEDEAVIGRVGLIVWDPETWQTTSV